MTLTGVPERVWTGAEWAEGPVWLAERGVVRFSDIPNDRIVEVEPATGAMAVVTEHAEFSNGRTLDRDGSVLQCSHGRRAVERVVGDVTTTVVDRWTPVAGGPAVRFNSPNDVAVASDGAIWFTDPPYGLHESGREGHPGEQEYDGCFVFRVADGVARPMVTDMVHPNGLAFSPDGSVLYVADSSFVWSPSHPRHLRAYDLVDGMPLHGRIFAEIEPGVPDGLRVDSRGRVWTSAGAQVRVYSPDGALLDAVEFPETVSNLCWGDGAWYVTATSSLYRLTPVA
jgi:gluconolactonase